MLRRSPFLLLAFLLGCFSPGGLVFAQQQASSTPLTVKAIFGEPGLTGNFPSQLQWRPDGKQVSYLLSEGSDHQRQLWVLDAAGGQASVLVNAQRLATLLPRPGANISEQERDHRRRYHVAPYHWAPDSAHLLFDSFGQLWLYTLATKTAVPMNPTSAPAYDPKFSPDGSRISYVREHNLYLRPVSGKRERALTHTSDPDLLNGEVDWVYKEELDARSNYFWSPDGREIALLQMDEGPVPDYPLVDFIPQHATVEAQKYPQAGDPNPVVRLGVVSAAGGGVDWITLPEQKRGAGWLSNFLHGCTRGCQPRYPQPGSAADIYIPRFGWVSHGLLYAEVLNRAQDEMKLYFIDPHSHRSQLMLDEKSDTWVPVNDDFRIIAPDKFLWSSWRDGHTHLYLYSFNPADPLSAPAKLERQLTRGEWEVAGVDTVAADRVYFTANKDDVRERQLYSVKLDGAGLERVSRQPGTHAATFSDAAAAPEYVDRFSALMIPPQLALCRAGAGCQVFFESRDLAAYDLRRPQWIDFTAADGAVLHGELLLPASTTEHSVPLLNNPYGGPGAQTVVDAWGGTHFLFDQLLAQEGIAVLHLDNRGMAGRGRQFAAVVRRDFGEHELADQLGAIDGALARFQQLDPRRLGWWGWSYGGFMTLNALCHSPRFRAGVAVAPVTDWHDYDSIYTERYLGLPQQNEAAYEKSSPVSYAGGLSGDLLIAHGTGDDNVHLQNTIQMAQKLLDARQQFELMLYPRKTHAIAGAEDQTDLFTRINAHFERGLGVPATLAGAPAGMHRP